MHTIRLRKPWQKQVGADVVQQTDVPDAIVVAAAQASSGASGQSVVYTRSFNCPTSLAADTRLWLRIDGWEGTLGRLTVNDVELAVGDDSAIRIDIRNVLQAANKLSVTLNCTKRNADSPAPPRLTGAVSLEIEDD